MVYSQSQTEKDTILRVEPGTYIQIRDSISFFLNDTLVRLPSSIIPSDGNLERIKIFSITIHSNKEHQKRALQKESTTSL